MRFLTICLKLLFRGLKIIDWVVSEGILPLKKNDSTHQQGAVTFNNEKVTDHGFLITIETDAILKIGKRRFFKLHAL